MKKGKVLVPVFALGRTQELLLLLDDYWERYPKYRNLGKIFYLNELANRSMVLFKESTHMMNKRVQDIINKEQYNPFDFRHVSIPGKMDDGSAWDINKMPPCVILCSPAMMENGMSRMVLEKIADGENNMVILTGYCMAVGDDDQ